MIQSQYFESVAMRAVTEPGIESNVTRFFQVAQVQGRLWLCSSVMNLAFHSCADNEMPTNRKRVKKISLDFCIIVKLKGKLLITIAKLLKK